MKKKKTKYDSCVLKAAKKSAIKPSLLQKVYNRGIGAWKTNPRSVRSKTGEKRKQGFPLSNRMGPEQWACARVKSFVSGSKKHDTDLRK